LSALEEAVIDEENGDAARVVDLAAANSPIDYRALCAFNREPARSERTLAALAAHHAPSSATIESYLEHAHRCRAALDLAPDLNAAVGLALADGVSEGAVALVAGLERVFDLVEHRWDELGPPLKSARPAKAWNARLAAIETLHGRDLIVHYLLRLPLLGVERDPMPCWRAFLVAAGQESTMNLVVDAFPGGSDDEEAPDSERAAVTTATLSGSFARLDPEALGALREALARGAVLCGAEGIGERFAERARATSAALGAEARGGRPSLETLAEWFARMGEGVEAHAPAPNAAPASPPASLPIGQREGSAVDLAGTPTPSGAASFGSAVSGSAVSDEGASVSATAASPLVLGDAAAARRALSGTVDWLCRHEPASPALPFVVVAEELDGRSLAEIATALDPGDGGTLLEAGRRLAAPLERLVLGRDAAELGARLAARREQALQRSGTDANPDVDVDVDVDGVEAGPDPAVEADGDMAAEGAEGARAGFDGGRDGAFATLAAVGVWFRRSEPSSPVAPLIERAVALSALRFEQIVAELARLGPDDSGEG